MAREEVGVSSTVRWSGKRCASTVLNIFSNQKSDSKIKKWEWEKMGIKILFPHTSNLTPMAPPQNDISVDFNWTSGTTI